MRIRGWFAEYRSNIKKTKKTLTYWYSHSCLSVFPFVFLSVFMVDGNCVGSIDLKCLKVLEHPKSMCTKQKPLLHFCQNYNPL